MKPINNLLEKVFGRLTVISRANNPKTRKNDTAAYWKCSCQCGKISIIRGYSLTSGKTQSCGCLKAEAPHLPLLSQSQPKYSSKESAAHLVWYGRNRYIEIPFEDFYRLSQQNCFYCAVEPSLIKISRRKDSSIFIYNTLDRIDSNKGHTIDNVVPACLICNRAKLDRSIEMFYLYIDNLINNLSRPSPEECRKALSKIVIPPDIHYAQLTSIKAIYADYHDGELTLEQFYQLTTANCYYCELKPINRRNITNKLGSQEAKGNGTFIYNGLDRIDNAIPHNYDNVVPCCKYCNTAKLQMSLQEFNDWITRLSYYTSSLEEERFSISLSIPPVNASTTGLFG